MDEKTIYQIYVGLMKLHKKYAAQEDKRHRLSIFIDDINQMNATFNSNFCNAMTDVLRRWCIKDFRGIDASIVAQFYTDLWRFHKRHIEPPRNDVYWRTITEEAGQLDKKYGLRPLQEYMLAIMDELENGDEEAGNDDKNGNTELRQGDYEQKEQEQSKSE